MPDLRCYAEDVVGSLCAAVVRVDFWNGPEGLGEGFHDGVELFVDGEGLDVGLWCYGAVEVGDLAADGVEMSAVDEQRGDVWRSRVVVRREGEAEMEADESVHVG